MTMEVTGEAGMGDRANVYVHDGDNHGVYLYTHWAGSELPEIIGAALARSEVRWTDARYLARVIFCEMIMSDPHWASPDSGVNGTTGYGISAEMDDGTERVADVDTRSQTVRLNTGEAIPFVRYIAQEHEWRT